MLLTQPYLLTLHPAQEMHVLILSDTPETAQVEYGNTPALDKHICCSRYRVNGIRAPREEGGYAEAPEDNPPMEVWQYIAVIDHLTAGKRARKPMISGLHPLRVRLIVLRSSVICSAWSPVGRP